MKRFKRGEKTKVLIKKRGTVLGIAEMYKFIS
ncbi:MAG: hypothetical protein ACJA0U_000368 [Salibacteraceae bacterium]|jgi:hypothetical protein